MFGEFDTFLDEDDMERVLLDELVSSKISS